MDLTEGMIAQQVGATVRSYYEIAKAVADELTGDDLSASLLVGDGHIPDILVLVMTEMMIMGSVS